MNVSDFSDAPFLESQHSQWFFNKINEHPHSAHHPLCSCYDHHLLRLGRLNLCLGCTCLGFGITFGLSLLILSQCYGYLPAVFTRLIPSWSIGVLFFLPTLAQPFLQLKAFKIVSRTLLGISIVILWHTAITVPSWDLKGVAVRLAFAFAFCLTFKFVNRFRNKFTPDPKLTCEKGCYPFCGGNELRFQRILGELKARADPQDPFIRFAESMIKSSDGQFEM